MFLQIPNSVCNHLVITPVRRLRLILKTCSVCIGAVTLEFQWFCGVFPLLLSPAIFILLRVPPAISAALEIEVTGLAGMN